MAETKKKRKTQEQFARRFEAEDLDLQALRLIAAPNPKDDLNDEQLVDYARKNRFPAEMIQHLIDYVKSI